MPTYTETKNSAKLSRDAIKDIERVIKSNVNLGGGYHVRTSYNSDNGTVAINFTGPHKTIDRVPREVVIAYADVLTKVNAWLNDQLADFPTL